MPLKGRLRKLLSSSTGAAAPGAQEDQQLSQSKGSPSGHRRRMSDVSENSSISYDRSSGSFVQRLSISLRSRAANKFSSDLRQSTRRRAASDAALDEADEEGLDVEHHRRPGSSFSAYYYRDKDRDDEESISMRKELSRDVTPLPSTSAQARGTAAEDSDSMGLVAPKPILREAPTVDPHPRIVEEDEKEEDSDEEDEDAGEEDDAVLPLPSAWGDQPTPEQLQQSQERVAAWLDRSRPFAQPPPSHQYQQQQQRRGTSTSPRSSSPANLNNRASPRLRPTGLLTPPNGQNQTGSPSPRMSVFPTSPSPRASPNRLGRSSPLPITPPPAASSNASLRFPSATIESSATLLDVPEEGSLGFDMNGDVEDGENEEFGLGLGLGKTIRQPLRMLDSISEDEVPGFAGSSVSTAPSTPLPPLMAPASQLQLGMSRSRSKSPPLRRRSLDSGQDEYALLNPNVNPSSGSALRGSGGGLDTIQESAVLPPSPRRSLDGSSMKKTSLALESIPEVELPSTAQEAAASGLFGPNRRKLGIKGFGLARSESEPVMPSLRVVQQSFGSSPKRKASTPPALNVGLFKSSGVKGKTSSTNDGVGRLASPGLLPFQRSPNLVLGQRSPLVSPSTPGLRKPTSARTQSLGDISRLTEEIED